MQTRHLCEKMAQDDVVAVTARILDNLTFYVGLSMLIILILIFVYKRFLTTDKDTQTPYKVIKAPEHKIKTPGKRVVAVLGSTGFIGSHVVDCLIESGQYHVYMLGRHFNNEKIHPKADAVFQVDMTDYDALVKAFKGVDSVIHSAAAIPTAYTTIDSIWRQNKDGANNVVTAAKECGVRNLIYVSGVKCAETPNSTEFKYLIDCFEQIELSILKANRVDVLNTCAVALTYIYGLRSLVFEKILKGEMSRVPFAEKSVDFAPVKLVAEAIKNAEQKLSENNPLVAGKTLNIMGQKSTFKHFFSLPQWGIKIGNLPIWQLMFLAKLNVFIASVTGKAPMGVELCPTICHFFDCLMDEEIDRKVAQEVLGIGEAPPLEKGISDMVAKFKQREEAKKTK